MFKTDDLLEFLLCGTIGAWVTLGVIWARRCHRRGKCRNGEKGGLSAQRVMMLCFGYPAMYTGLMCGIIFLSNFSSELRWTILLGILTVLGVLYAVISIGLPVAMRCQRDRPDFMGLRQPAGRKQYQNWRIKMRSQAWHHGYPDDMAREIFFAPGIILVAVWNRLTDSEEERRIDRRRLGNLLRYDVFTGKVSFDEEE